MAISPTTGVEANDTIWSTVPNSAAVDSISKASGFAVYPVYSNSVDLEATRRRLTEAG